MQVAVNKVVTIDFTLFDEEDNVLESSRNEGPLSYLHGGGELPEGLEERLEGKQAGDEVQVTLSPEDAYGDYDEDLRQSVPREQFEDIDTIEVGMRFEAETDDGSQVVRVVGIEGDEVIVDANEPYAGLTVRFDVKVLGVRDASESELEHGHVHNEHCDHD